MPGHTARRRGRPRARRTYWQLPGAGAATARRHDDEVPASCLDELEESVRLRLMSDVPLGAMLSGGLDSSLIVALMARNMREPVKTFSVGFAEAGERERARRRALGRIAFGTDHHELELSLRGADASISTELVWYLDEPLADLSALGFLALSGLAARARHGRALRPGRRRAPRRLHEAPRGRGRRGTGVACPRPVRGAGAGLRRARPAPAPARRADAGRAGCGRAAARR